MNELKRIAVRRLRSQRLTGPKFNEPVEAIQWLGAVQAQDFAAAKWSLALRVKGSTDVGLNQAFSGGRFIRTHIMRPTWHLVAPEDLRWMQALTSQRARRGLSASDRKLGLTPSVLSRAGAIITRALTGRHLTRAEITAHLERGGIQARGQRLAHILGHLEFDSLICSGPLEGRQFTYALADERVPPARTLRRDEALATLAQRYFTSHGPAQLGDFIWWSGLGAQEAAQAVNLIRPELVREDVDEKTYWSAAAAGTARLAAPHARLLALWDEFLIAYKDRGASAPGGLLERLLRMGSAINAVMVLDGQVIGTWKRKLLKGGAQITLKPLRRLTAPHRDAFADQVSRYKAFLGPAT